MMFVASVRRDIGLAVSIDVTHLLFLGAGELAGALGIGLAAVGPLLPGSGSFPVGLE